MTIDKGAAVGSGDEAAASWTARAPLPGERTPALSLLLTGKATGGEAAVRRFDDYLARQGLGDAVVRAVWRGGRPVSTAAAVLNPGRSAMVFVSRPRTLHGDPAGVSSVKALLSALPATRVRLAQALLEPSQAGERGVLTAAGMTELATLAYLSRSLETADRGSSIARSALTRLGLRVETWTPGRAAAFSRAVELSYEQTRDCPALRGVRSMADVMAGHRAAGEFDPSRWVLATDADGEPAGVMLLTALPTESAGELVYLGVPVAWRGRGIGSKLVRLGLALLAEAGLGRMLLAVDRSNEPALRLYRQAGLVAMGRRDAWMRVVGEDVVS